MIGPGTGVRVYLACGITDMRKGIGGLAMLAQDVLRQKPTGGAVFAFRGRRGDRLKLLYWDGQGFCLYYKILERGRFPWPSAEGGTARLTSAQLGMLWEGIDWRRPDWGAPPARVGYLLYLFTRLAQGHLNKDIDALMPWTYAASSNPSQ
jgi:transposase